MKMKDNMPAWVYWGLWGINTRATALVYVIVTLVLAVVVIAYALQVAQYELCLFVLVPVWYWLALRWVDKNSSWPQ